jgi:hypothetical protein
VSAVAAVAVARSVHFLVRSISEPSKPTPARRQRGALWTPDEFRCNPDAAESSSAPHQEVCIFEDFLSAGRASALFELVDVLRNGTKPEVAVVKSDVSSAFATSRRQSSVSRRDTSRCCARLIGFRKRGLRSARPASYVEPDAVAVV